MRTLPPLPCTTSVSPAISSIRSDAATCAISARRNPASAASLSTTRARASAIDSASRYARSLAGRGTAGPGATVGKLSAGFESIKPDSCAHVKKARRLAYVERLVSRLHSFSPAQRSTCAAVTSAGAPTLACRENRRRCSVLVSIVCGERPAARNDRSQLSSALAHAGVIEYCFIAIILARTRGPRDMQQNQ